MTDKTNGKDMRSYLRFLWRNRLYSTINLVGLTVALALSIIIFSYAAAQVRISKDIDGWQDIYAVCRNNSTAMCYGMAGALMNAMPEAAAVTKFSSPDNGTPAEYGGKKYSTDMMFADSSFFRMFNVGFKEGNADQGLGNYEIFISETFAHRIARDGEALVGKTLKVAGRDFIIKGITADFGRNILPYADLIVNIDGKEFQTQYKTQPFNVFGDINTFVRLYPGTDISGLGEKITGIYFKACGMDMEMSEEYNFSFVRIDKLYFHPGNWFLNSGNAKAIRNLTSAGIALLPSALFNYINLSVALSVKRAREMATRRLLGSSTGEIRRRYIAEALMFTSFCFIAGLLIAAAAVPSVNWLICDPSSISQTAELRTGDIFVPSTFAGCIVLILVLSLAAGLIPASAVMRYSPSEIMKGAMDARRRTVFSKIFIVIQNIISIVLIALAITMETQMKHMLDRPSGYDLEDLYYLNTDFTGKDGIRFLDNLKALPCVNEAGICEYLPGAIGSCFTSPDINGNEVRYYNMSCDTVTFNMLNFNIIEKYSDNMPGAVWVNENAAAAAGITGSSTDLSKTIMFNEGDTGTAHNASGILGNYIIVDAGFPEKTENAVIFIKDQDQFWYCNYAIKTAGDHASAKKMITDAYNSFCLEIFGIETPAWENGYMEDILENSLDAAKRNMRLIEIFMVMAIILSLSGLVAISIFYADSNRKSIALHKVYGGTVGSETGRNIRIYMIMTVIADIVAVPAAVILCRRYLEEFAYRIDLGAWIFIVTTALSLLMTAASVLWQVSRAARTDPADALKTE